MLDKYSAKRINNIIDALDQKIQINPNRARYSFYNIKADFYRSIVEQFVRPIYEAKGYLVDVYEEPHVVMGATMGNNLVIKITQIK